MVARVCSLSEHAKSLCRILERGHCAKQPFGRGDGKIILRGILGK
jgi:hypothetical protein